MNEPIPAVTVINPASLMRSVDRGRALLQHDPSLKGAEKAVGAKRQLIAGTDASGRAENPVNTVAAVKFGTFHRDISVFRTVINPAPFIQD